MDEPKTSVIKDIGRLSFTLFLRYVIYLVIAVVIGSIFYGSNVFGPSLIIIMLVAVVMHEALHMIPLESFKVDHGEYLLFSVIKVDATDLSWKKTLFVLILPPLLLIPFGYFLFSTGNIVFAPAGLAIMAIHIIILGVELFSTLVASRK